MTATVSTASYFLVIPSTVPIDSYSFFTDADVTSVEERQDKE
jgi:hypothetical protein